MTEKNVNFQFRVLNIKLRKKSKEDATPEEYVKLLKKAFNAKIHMLSSPNKHCIFRSLFESRQSVDGKTVTNYIYGYFAQFTFIENKKWFNLEKLDLDEEFKVPDGLFPDAKLTEFVFVPAAHRFGYRISSEFQVSPNSVKKYLEASLNEVCNKSKEFVQVDVESDKVSIDTILAAKAIKKLTIDINYSNVDLGSDLKKFVEEDIKASNTDRLKIEATQQPYTSIDVAKSKILKGAIESSISNGETTATIIDENDKTKTIKTSDFPRKEIVTGKPGQFNNLAYERIMKLFRPRNANKAN